jgi:hypothetical protein
MNAKNNNRCENIKPTLENDSNERKRKRFFWTTKLDAILLELKPLNSTYLNRKVASLF